MAAEVGRDRRVAQRGRRTARARARRARCRGGRRGTARWVCACRADQLGQVGRRHPAPANRRVGVGLVEPGEDAQERRLPGAVLADDADARGVVHLEVEAIENGARAERFHGAAERDQGRHRPRSVVSELVIDVPQTAVTPLVLRHAERLAGRPAMIAADGSEVITYGELPGRIGRMAAGLRELGLGRGDVLALVLPNVPEFVVAFHAAATLGAVVTPVNPSFTPDEARRQLADSGARLVVTLPELTPAAAAAAEGTGVERVIALGDPGLEAASVVGQVALDPERDLVALPYSSGTTGFAKGVMLTHRNLVANVIQVESVFGIGESDTMAAVLPFFHIYGLTVNMNFAARPRCDRRHDAPVRPGCVPGGGRAPPGHAGVSGAAHPARAGQAPRGRSPRHLVASGHRVGCGAAPRRSRPRLRGPARVRRLPGLRAHRGEPGHPSPARRPRRRRAPGSVGTALPGHRVPGGRSRDATAPAGRRGRRDHRPRPAGDAGLSARPRGDGGGDRRRRLAAYGRSRPRRPRRPAAPRRPAEGADQGARVSRWRRRSSRPCSCSHPAVADAAVIARPTDRRGNEAPKALVVLRAPVEPAELQRYVAERVAPHKRLRRVEVIDAVPRTASGKILRRVLIERERERGQGAH